MTTDDEVHQLSELTERVIAAERASARAAADARITELEAALGHLLRAYRNVRLAQGLTEKHVDSLPLVEAARVALHSAKGIATDVA